ncbi:hypothetical protein BA190_08345 [Labrys sp. WJW]|nr:hypothetical protein BA190_08345 [Labrys sp. WJW]
MQGIDPAHQSQIDGGDFTGQMVDTAAADPASLRMPIERQIVPTIDHRFALKRPAFPSAPDKKSFSGVSCPIFARSVFRSIAGAGTAAFASHRRRPQPHREADCAIA